MLIFFTLKSGVKLQTSDAERDLGLISATPNPLACSESLRSCSPSWASLDPLTTVANVTPCNESNTPPGPHLYCDASLQR